MFCTNVDTTGRLIHDQDIRIICQPSCNDNLLLVTTGQVRDMLLHIRSLDAQLLDTVIYDSVDRLMIKHKSGFQMFVINRNTYIILDGKTSKNTISTSVLCDQTDSGFHGICRMFDIYFFAFNINLSGLDRSHSENAFQKLCSLSSYQTTKSEDLTFAECERYILE